MCTSTRRGDGLVTSRLSQRCLLGEQEMTDDVFLVTEAGSDCHTREKALVQHGYRGDDMSQSHMRIPQVSTYRGDEGITRGAIGGITGHVVRTSGLMARTKCVHKREAPHGRTA